MQFFYFTFHFSQKPMVSMLFLLMLTSSILNAKSYTPFSTDCNTLISKKDDMRLVLVLKPSVGMLSYQDCDEPSGKFKQMPRGDVQDIRIYSKTKRLFSLLEGRHRKRSDSSLNPNLRLAPVGLALTLMGILMFLLLFFSWTGFYELLFVASICLIITGIVFSIISLRVTRNSKEMYKEERRMAMAGLLVGLLPIVFSLLIYLFYFVYNL